MTINDILNLDIPKQFGSDEDGEETDSMGIVYSQLNKDVETRYGASKFVIYLNDNEVVKIPFNGCFWYDCEEEDGYHFDSFYYEDYCAIEAAFYNDAIKNGVEKFFASVKCYGHTISKTPVYICERVFPFYENGAVREKTDSFSENSLKKAEEMKKTFSTRLHREWLARAIEYYGEDAVNDLLTFIQEEDINDLHAENVGFRKDGSPVILDYSGYKEG